MLRASRHARKPSVKSLPGDARPCPFRLAAALGICFTLAAGVSARAGDFLRGGGVTGAHGAPAAFGASPATTTQARNNARDVLSRTTQAVQDVKAMQAAASAAARSAVNLGPDPNHPGFALPSLINSAMDFTGNAGCVISMLGKLAHTEIGA